MLIFVIIPCTLLYFSINRASAIGLNEPKFWGKEILFVIAHPGDETKLFIPSIL